MIAKKIKKQLIDRGITIADIAREITPDDRSVNATRMMISQMIHRRYFYPTLAAKLKAEYGISIPRPRPGELQRAA